MVVKEPRVVTTGLASSFLGPLSLGVALEGIENSSNYTFIHIFCLCPGPRLLKGRSQEFNPLSETKPPGAQIVAEVGKCGRA